MCRQSQRCRPGGTQTPLVLCQCGCLVVSTLYCAVQFSIRSAVLQKLTRTDFLPRLGCGMFQLSVFSQFPFHWLGNRLAFHSALSYVGSQAAES